MTSKTKFRLQPGEHKLVLEAQPIQPGWMIAPRSYLMDRILPDHERIWMPATKTGGGEATLILGMQTFAPPQLGGLRARMRKLSPAQTLDDLSRPVIDLRPGHPENWAHFLNIHLTLLALAARELGVAPQEFQVLLPSKMPGYIQSLASVLKLDCLYTDAALTGFGVQFSFENGNNVRGMRCQLLLDPRISPVMMALESETLEQVDTPPRLFLSRKDTRRLINETEIKAVLEPQGFKTIYMEDHSPAVQLRMLMQAEEVVAVHGAALAPLFYRKTSAPPIRLVELFPVGHLTNVYRAPITAQSGHWCGIRGYITAENLREIYQLNKPYRKHSLDAFQVDPDALNLALDFVRGDGTGLPA